MKRTQMGKPWPTVSLSACIIAESTKRTSKKYVVDTTFIMSAETVKMEVVGSSETLVIAYKATRATIRTITSDFFTAARCSSLRVTELVYT